MSNLGFAFKPLLLALESHSMVPDLLLVARQGHFRLHSAVLSFVLLGGLPRGVLRRQSRLLLSWVNGWIVMGEWMGDDG